LDLLKQKIPVAFIEQVIKSSNDTAADYKEALENALG